MNKKITNLFRDFVIASKLIDAEMVQVWDEQGAFDSEQLDFSMHEQQSYFFNNSYSATLFIESMPIKHFDMLKIIVAMFARYYAEKQEIEWESPQLDKESCQALFYLELSDKMIITNADGVLAIEYCNPAVDDSFPVYDNE